MLTGAVTPHREARVSFEVRKPGGKETSITAMIDTGFSASLTLPPSTIASLGLSRQSMGRAVLADGSVREFGMYGAEVNWGGWKRILVSAVGSEVLIGMGLLRGYELRVEVVTGGRVEIRPLSEQDRKD
jgi:clan AA aspartic protease